MGQMTEVHLICKRRRDVNDSRDAALEVRIEGVWLGKILNEDPLEILGMGCDTTVGLELRRLLSFPDNSAHYEASF